LSGLVDWSVFTHRWFFLEICTLISSGPETKEFHVRFEMHTLVTMNTISWDVMLRTSQGIEFHFCPNDQINQVPKNVSSQLAEYMVL